MLRGTVLKQGDGVRVAAELLSAEEGQSQLWSGEYERLVDDIKPSVAEPLTKRVPVSVGVARALLWGRPGDPYAPHTGANIAYLPGRKKGVDEGAAFTDSRGARS